MGKAQPAEFVSGPARPGSQYGAAGKSAETSRAAALSVQSPQEALAALENEDVRHIQMPFNILDWRWREAGVIGRVRERGDVTVHARDVFLRGILAANEPAMWPCMRGLDARALVKTLRSLAKEFRRESVADLCVAYVRGQDWVDGIVIGGEPEEKPDANLRLFLRSPLSTADCAKIEAQIPRVPAQLLDPASWPRLF
jgi:aryl-alcohol dehydrogenase-like predicted oxidoreductase